MSQTKLAEVDVISTDTWRTVLNALATQLDASTITDYKMLIMVTPVHRWNGQYVRTTDSIAFNYMSLAGGGVQINMCSLLFTGGNSLYRRQEGSSAIADRSTEATGEQGTWTIWGFK